MSTLVVSAALQARYPDGVPTEWEDSTGVYLGLVLPGGQKIVDTTYRIKLTPAEQAAKDAAAAAEAARQAKIEAIIDNARTIRNAITAATLTFGSAPRDNAIKGLARAVLFLAKNEVD